MINDANEVKEIISAPRSGLSAFSRYRFVPVLEQNYRDYLDLPYNIDIFDLDATSVFQVTVKEENRLDKISQDFYDTTRLWWVLALYNRIEDPFDLPLLTKIYIPSLESLYQLGII